MSKLPWMKFYPADWSQDTTQLSLCARGAWITIVCAMWRSETRGKLVMSKQGFCRLLGASESETLAAIDELAEKKIYEITRGDLIIIRRITRKSNRPPESIWKIIRDRIFHRDNYTCQYCGAYGVRLECDHIVPVSRGGKHEDKNLNTACFFCNRSKRAKMLEEWNYKKQ